MSWTIATRTGNRRGVGLASAAVMPACSAGWAHGRSVYTPLFEGVYWDVQDVVLDDIDRIEVIRGPGGTIWGANAVNGVINIITKKAADTQGGMVSANGGGAVSRFTGEVRLGLHPTTNLQLRLFAKGFDRGAEADPGGNPYDDWHQERGGVRADWQPTARDTIMAISEVYGGVTGDQNTIGGFYPPSQLVADGRQLVSGGDVVIRWDRRLAGESGFYVEGYYSRTNRATSQFSETSPHREASAQAVFRLPHRVEIVPDYRFMSALPAENVKSYETADAHLSYRTEHHVSFSATGRNLLQARHLESVGDNENLAGIKREVYGGLVWEW